MHSCLRQTGLICGIVSQSLPTGRQGWYQRFMDFFRNLIDDIHSN